MTETTTAPVDGPAPDACDPRQRERSHLAASWAALRAMHTDVQSLDIRDVTTNTVNAAVLKADAEGAEGERFYIGRRHVHDKDGDPMVVDWRAPVSQPFYRASRPDPLDVRLRRRFGYSGGDLTAYEDEHLSDPAESERTSRLLQ